jgi:hypothetical protein
VVSNGRSRNANRLVERWETQARRVSLISLSVVPPQVHGWRGSYECREVWFQFSPTYAVARQCPSTKIKSSFPLSTTISSGSLSPHCSLDWMSVIFFAKSSRSYSESRAPASASLSTTRCGDRVPCVPSPAVLLRNVLQPIQIRVFYQHTAPLHVFRKYPLPFKISHSVGLQRRGGRQEEGACVA